MLKIFICEALLSYLSSLFFINLEHTVNQFDHINKFEQFMVKLLDAV